jgi:hypothetical protein
MRDQLSKLACRFLNETLLQPLHPLRNFSKDWARSIAFRKRNLRWSVRPPPSSSERRNTEIPASPCWLWIYFSTVAVVDAHNSSGVPSLTVSAASETTTF